MQEVKDQVRSLLQLNGIDRQRHACQVELNEAPRRLEQLASELDSRVAARDDAQGRLDAARSALSSGEDDLAGKERRRVRARERMPLLQTSTQIEATQREIAALGDEIDTLELELLESMEGIEVLTSEVAGASTQVEAAVSELSTAREAWAERQPLLEADSARLDAEREPIATGLRSDLVRRYRVAWRQKGQATPSGVTSVVKQVCETCHTQISARWIQEGRSYAAIHNCDRCKRLLLFDPDASAPEAGDESASPAPA